MIFAVLDPSPLTVCINCSFFNTFIGLLVATQRETIDHNRDPLSRRRLQNVAWTTKSLASFPDTTHGEMNNAWTFLRQFVLRQDKPDTSQFKPLRKRLVAAYRPNMRLMATYGGG